MNHFSEMKVVIYFMLKHRKNFLQYFNARTFRKNGVRASFKCFIIYLVLSSSSHQYGIRSAPSVVTPCCSMHENEGGCRGHP